MADLIIPRTSLQQRAGTVHLVGAGPGDPGLLTLRAARLLRRADVVLHDSLVGADILRLVRAGAETIDVGKRCGGHRTDQDDINRLLIDAALRARTVVRLKGGDPFVFGRGGEEAVAVRAAGIRCEIVPGITAALGAAAYAGIPLTQRGVSSAVTFVTGHGCTEAGAAQVDWQQHAQPHQTLVVYMGVKSVGAFASRLIAAGRSPATPAAAIERGTQPGQRTIVATLGELDAATAAAAITGPALFIIGEVVALRSRIAWFERRPLHGLRVLVARSRPQPSRLARRLARLGADVIEAPEFEMLPPVHTDPLDDALLHTHDYDWLAFTDAAAVDACWDAVHRLGRDTRSFAHTRFLAFGTATAAALARHGVRADITTSTYAPWSVAAHREELVQSLSSRLLFLRAEGPASPVAAALRDTGARVDEVVACRAAARSDQHDAVRDRLLDGRVDVVVFASSNSVRIFQDSYGDSHGASAGAPRIAAIGPATAAAAAARGLTVDVVAAHATFASLIRAIRD
ncbi:MAG: uroporphyrinogen-III C-methyltransferase [Gemmatimonadota bacterium]